MKPHCSLALALVSIAGTLNAQQLASETTFADAHVHLNDPDMQLRLMREAGNELAVVFWGRNSDNERLARWAAEHPGRFVPFASISPERRKYRPFWDDSDVTLLTELEHLLQRGVYRGIGEISVAHFPARGFPEADYSPLHPLMRGIMDLARRFAVPVNIHCEITRIREFEQLLERYSDVTVIWAHGGYTPYFLAKRMLAEHPNLYYELSARTWQAHPRSPDYTILKDGENVWPRWLRLIEDNPRRFLVGTDASHHDLGRERRKLKSVQNLLQQLSPATRRRVAHENLHEVLGD